MNWVWINARRVAAQLVIGRRYGQSAVEPVVARGDRFHLAMRTLIVPLQIETRAASGHPVALLSALSDVNAQCEICLADAAAGRVYDGLPPFEQDDALIAQTRLAATGLDGGDSETAHAAWDNGGLTSEGAVRLLRFAALAIGGLGTDDGELGGAVAVQAERVARTVERRLEAEPARSAVEEVAARLVDQGALKPEDILELLDGVTSPDRPFGFPADYGWEWLQRRAGLPLEHPKFGQRRGGSRRALAPASG